jgi:hypothetical protein
MTSKRSLPEAAIVSRFPFTVREARISANSCRSDSTRAGVSRISTFSPLRTACSIQRGATQGVRSPMLPLTRGRKSHLPPRLRVNAKRVSCSTTTKNERSQAIWNRRAGVEARPTQEPSLRQGPDQVPYVPQEISRCRAVSESCLHAGSALPELAVPLAARFP